MNKNKIQIEGHKLMYHVNRVSKWQQGEKIAPIYVEIGPTSACNHRCVFCAFDYLRDKEKKYIDKDVLIKNLKSMADVGVKSIMFCGEGEPFAYPNIVEVCKKADEFGLDVAITTNGVLFTEDKFEILKYLKWIKMSVDSGTPENYAKIHGTEKEDFPKLLENLKKSCEYKKQNNLNCTIGCQSIVMDETIDDVENLIKEIKEFGLDYLVLKPYVKHPESKNIHYLTAEDYDSKLMSLVAKYKNKNFNIIYRRQSFKESEKSELDYPVCHGINFTALIDANGNVVPCSVFHNKKDFTYGNINNQTFEKIWKSNKRNEIMKKVYEKGNVNCRNHCRLNFINQYLHKLKTKDIKHINFI